MSSKPGLTHRKAFRLSRQAGFTVVELVVGITIGSILFLAFMAALTNQFVLITKNNASIDMAANSQNLLRATVEALRVGDGVRQTNTIADANAPSGGWNTSNANFVIVIASPALNSARSYIIDPDTGGPYMNELVYYKSATSLMERRLANPSASGNSLVTSCPPSSSSQSCPPDKLLADYVQSMAFTLYDQDNNLTTDPALARLIQINLGLQRYVFGSAISMNNSIWVTLRNRF
ncbi:MAG: prepilin-type N-terminal cleavage/methylation domain-containing protein [bacterium]|nr:prepilin-type N-terminal cleavage/methylation domain-containing protein [bacterium]